MLDATHGEGADVVIEAAGAAAAIAEGLDLARVGGRYVIAGHYTDVGGSRSTRTSRSTASTSRSAAAGAARRGHFLRALVDPRAPSVDPVPQDRRAPLRAASAERGARRRRSHAHPEGAGRSVAADCGDTEDRRHARPVQQPRRPSSTRSIAARRRRVPAELLARHARVARADIPRASATRPRAPAGTSPSSRISAGRRSAPDRLRGGAADRRCTRATSCASPPATARAVPGRVFTPYAELDRVGRSPAIGCCSTTARSSCACRARAPASSSTDGRRTAASSASTRASTRRA